MGVVCSPRGRLRVHRWAGPVCDGAEEDGLGVEAALHSLIHRLQHVEAEA